MGIKPCLIKGLWYIQDIATNTYFSIFHPRKYAAVDHSIKTDEHPDVVGEVVSLIPPQGLMRNNFFGKPVKTSEDEELPEWSDSWF